MSQKLSTSFKIATKYNSKITNLISHLGNYQESSHLLS